MKDSENLVDKKVEESLLQMLKNLRELKQSEMDRSNGLHSTTVLGSSFSS